MPVANWADKLAAAQSMPSFKPLDAGRYAFVVKKAEVQSNDSTGAQSINMQIAVEDGERKNATMFHTFYPDSEKAYALKMFFEGMAALGFGIEFFQQQPQPSYEQIAQLVVGKRFSADVTLRNGENGSDVSKDNKGEFRRQLSNLTAAIGSAPVGGAPSAPAAPQAPAYSAPVAPQAPQAPQAPAAPAAQGGSPWGAPAAGNLPTPPENPFG